MSQPLQYSDEQVAALILPTLNQLFNLRGLANAARQAEHSVKKSSSVIPDISKPTSNVFIISAHALESVPENESGQKSGKTTDFDNIDEEEMHATMRYRSSLWIFTVLCVMFGLSLLLFTLVRYTTQDAVCVQVHGWNMLDSAIYVSLKNIYFGELSPYLFTCK